MLALWAASGATDALIKAFNRAHGGTEGRRFLKRCLLALGLTVGLSLLIPSAFVLCLFGQRLGTWVTDQASFGAAFGRAWNLVQWPVVVVFVLLALTVLY